MSFANFLTNEGKHVHFSQSQVNENSKTDDEKNLYLCICDNNFKSRRSKLKIHLALTESFPLFFSPSHILAVRVPTICFAAPKEQTWKTSVPHDAEISWNIHLAQTRLKA